MVRFCSGHSPPLSQTGQSSGWEVSRNSTVLFCPSFAFWVLVRTTRPSSTLLVQPVSSLGRNWIFGSPFSITNSPVARSRTGRPISTRHMRHMPTGSSLGWWQKTGISMPTVLAASTTLSPSGTVTLIPSMVRVTCFAISLLRSLVFDDCWRGSGCHSALEILREALDTGNDGHGRKLAQRAQALPLNLLGYI